MIEKVLWATVLGITGIACLICYYFATYDTPPIPEKQLKGLVAGTTKDEIKRRFGTPDHVYTMGREWVYADWYRLPAVYIYFDTNSAYLRYRIDD